MSVRGVVRVETQAARQRLEVGAARRHEGGHVRPALAHHDRPVDPLAGAELVLQVRRVDVLAVGEDEGVVETADDAQAAVGVDERQVAGVEPAVGAEHLRRPLRVLVVAAHDVGPADLQAADVAGAARSAVLVRETMLHAADHVAGGPQQAAVRVPHGDHHDGLRHAVALQQRHAGGVEELVHGVGQRAAADAGKAQAAAEPGPDLAEDQAVGERVEGGQGGGLDQCPRVGARPPERAATAAPRARGPRASAARARTTASGPPASARAAGARASGRRS